MLVQRRLYSVSMSKPIRTPPLPLFAEQQAEEKYVVCCCHRNSFLLVQIYSFFEKTKCLQKIFSWKLKSLQTVRFDS